MYGTDRFVAQKQQNTAVSRVPLNQKLILFPGNKGAKSGEKARRRGESSDPVFETCESENGSRLSPE